MPATTTFEVLGFRTVWDSRHWVQNKITFKRWTWEQIQKLERQLPLDLLMFSFISASSFFTKDLSVDIEMYGYLPQKFMVQKDSSWGTFEETFLFFF